MYIHRCVTALLIAALSILSLGGCDKLTTTTTTVRTLQDGARNDKSWSRTWRDRAEFRCMASSSGRCNIIVFVSVCVGTACETQLVQELALAAGASRTLSALPHGFRHCVAHDAKPVAPTCLKA